MKTMEAVVVILVVALGVSIIANFALYAYYTGGTTNLNETFPLSGSATGASGLNLSIALNRASIMPGQGIEVTISETNTLGTANTVSVASDWQFSPLSDSPCGVGSYPMGIAICQGYYTASDISSAEALWVYSYGVYACPMLEQLIASYTFQPLSNMASINSGPPFNSSYTQPINATLSANGYWGMTAKDFHSFSPGIYTVVGGDEWGQLVLLHFLVV
ncbi:MAG: hypothetical protein ABSF36_03355 [Candidatus Methanomethylicaceae archaeon]|jgi:hypothetical protein